MDLQQVFADIVARCSLCFVACFVPNDPVIKYSVVSYFEDWFIFVDDRRKLLSCY